MTGRIILASSSPFRLAMLRNAGIPTEAIPSRIDERAVESGLGDAPVSADEVASILAEAKAVEVSERHPEALVVGSDQTLSLDGEIFHKAVDMEDARRRLLRLSGRTHHLNSAVVLAKAGEPVWRHVSIARMTMRTLDPGFVGRYLSRVGDQVLRSVGVYQIEGEGIQLFDAIDGDHFTIVGMPLLPLIGELRKRGAIDG